MKRPVILIVLLLIGCYVFPCTSVIVSGKYTIDGRSIMWKQRDTRSFNNKLIYINQGKYQAIVLVNSNDTIPKSIWMGFNSAGFAIMNTLSYNVISDSGSRNGNIMKRALLECASIDEFEQLIETLPCPKNLRANFGVIDADGGAAYFETGDYSYTRFDVNDKNVAPHGYMVRTNYSFSGEANEGQGYIRYETADKLLYNASCANNLSVEFIMEELMISLENSLTGVNARECMSPSSTDNYIYFQDCINRFTSSSSIIIQGVKEAESPLLTTMWAMVGFPLSSVVMPVWLISEGSLPEVITAPGQGNAEICDLALKLKEEMVPSRRGSTQYYINTTKAFNSDYTGITQQLRPLNREIYSRTIKRMEKWRHREVIESEIKDLYNWYDRRIRKTYYDCFKMKIIQ